MIITIGREFGSGGRELGKRLADALNIKYYDKEIFSLIAKESQLDERYVQSMMEKGLPSTFYFTFANTISASPVYTSNSAYDILSNQRSIIEKLAEEDCVIVGRSAEAILKDKKPFRIFVYADEEFKMDRCKKRAKEGENLTDKLLRKKMKKVDQGRARFHSIVADTKWGDKSGYDLMINTSGIEIKSIIPAVSGYIKEYYKKLEKNNNI